MVFWFLMGTVFGLLAAVAFWLWREVADEEPTEEGPDEGALQKAFQQQAELLNFWNYDGSAQRDAADVAAVLYQRYRDSK